MRYESVIKSHLFEAMPEKIKTDDGTTVTIKETRIIINEFDKNIDPLCPYAVDKGFTVGLKVVAERRHFKQESDNRCSARVEKEQVGDYMVLTHDAKLKDVIECINDLIRNVCNSIVDKPSEA